MYEFRRTPLITRQEFFKQVLGCVVIRDVRDRADICNHWRRQRHLQHVLAGTLLQMELAALRGHAREHRLARCLQSQIGVTDDRLKAMRAEVIQFGQKRPPVDLRLNERTGQPSTSRLPSAPTPQ